MGTFAYPAAPAPEGIDMAEMKMEVLDDRVTIYIALFFIMIVVYGHPNTTFPYQDKRNYSNLHGNQVISIWRVLVVKLLLCQPSRGVWLSTTMCQTTLLNLKRVFNR